MVRVCPRHAGLDLFSSGFRVYRFWVDGMGFGDASLGFWAAGFGSGVQGLGVRASFGG